MVIQILLQSIFSTDRVEVFFKEITVDGPLAITTKYYAELLPRKIPVRGSPHVHYILWVIDAPALTSNNKEEYVAFIDQIIHAFLPENERKEKPELH